jgi:hypothetical protein
MPESQLRAACDFARAHGMGMEMEFDDRLIRQPVDFAPRLDDYLKAFADSGVKEAGSISYYEGGGAILHLARSSQKSAHAYYDRVAQWVEDRQALADGQCRAASK